MAEVAGGQADTSEGKEVATAEEKTAMQGEIKDALGELLGIAEDFSDKEYLELSTASNFVRYSEAWT